MPLGDGRSFGALITGVPDTYALPLPNDLQLNMGICKDKKVWFLEALRWMEERNFIETFIDYQFRFNIRTETVETVRLVGSQIGVRWSVNGKAVRKYRFGLQYKLHSVAYRWKKGDSQLEFASEYMNATK
ncbi:hypothetical protein EV368DRAFT_69625 [Lentinula lateritia]|nr:hypothetical protein EV368DRAFT_69625 [Lentinula lateritia]